MVTYIAQCKANTKASNKINSMNYKQTFREGIVTFPVCIAIFTLNVL